MELTHTYAFIGGNQRKQIALEMSHLNSNEERV